jgi:hypothetical protein
VADLYDRDTPPVGIFALRDVARCLRETGRFVDEEGEATNALEDLLDRLDSTPDVPACAHDWSNVDSDGSVWPVADSICRKCGQRKAAAGVSPTPAPRYAVRWSTGGYLAYEKDGGRTLTPDELEKALNADGVKEVPRG